MFAGLIQDLVFEPYRETPEWKAFLAPAPKK
jgi:hypothetical protein